MHLPARSYMRVTDEEAARHGLQLPTPSSGWKLGGLALPMGVALHRSVLCGLALALLWCTSLAASRHVANAFVTSPSFQSVVGECQRAYDEVHRQREAHLDCTKRQSRTCSRSLQDALALEKARSLQAASTNRAQLAAAAERQQRCAIRQLQALDGVQRLQAAGIPLAWHEPSDGEMCTTGQRQRAQALVGDISAARSHALDVASRYAQNVQLLQRGSLEGLDNLRAYDSRYVQLKAGVLGALPGRLSAATQTQASQVKGTLRRLNASMRVCASADGPGHSCQLPLEPQIAQMRSQYDALLTAMSQQQKELASFHDSMNAMVAAVKVPIDTIQRVAQNIDPGLHLPKLDVPEMHLPEVHLPPLPSMEELKAELSSYAREQQAEARAYLEQAAGSTDKWQSTVVDATGDVDRLLDDYTPPPFNTSAARLQINGETERFLAEQRSALSAFAIAPTAADANLTTNDINSSFSFSSVPSLFSGSGLQFEPFAQSTLDFQVITVAMESVAWIATLSDLLWRAWRSGRLVLKYWSKASIGLPVLDLREGQASSAMVTACGELGKSPERCLSACLVSPISGVAIVAVALVLTLNAAAAIYAPMYLDYVEGCISPPRNGTFLSRNLFSVAYNYAATEGNQRLLHELDLYHSARAANCSVEVRDTAGQQLQAERVAGATQRAYAQSLDGVRLMRSCLRLQVLDDAAAKAGIQPYVPLREVLADDACNVGTLHENSLSLENGVFNCSAVTQCESACDGPSREVTAALCQRCGCHTEWLAHGMILHVFLALFVFASLNASRWLLVDGACRMFWKQLFAGEFEFMANCDDRGVARVGREQILSALRLAVRGYVQTGWLMLLSAFVLNIPWILALDYVGHHLDAGHAVAPGSLS